MRDVVDVHAHCVEAGELQAVTMERDMLRAALADLHEEAQDMRSYVPEYFAKKWKHDEALDRAALALGQIGERP